MPSRVTFLGASVSNFQTSIGWGTKTSQLNITLVEDPTNGDNFAPPLVGQPVYFSYGSLSFGGILQSWRKKHSETANPVYEVVVIDPRDILDGVQLIIADYTGDTSAVPNLYNVYRYWENTGFGNSLVNDTGMPWTQVRDGYLAIEAGTNISFRGNSYTVDFTALNNQQLSSNYRIGGASVSLLDFIDEVCNAVGCDYYISLEAGAIITLHTISRRITPVAGAIDAFVTAQSEVTTKESGRELRNETTSKFLTGGQQEYFYYGWYVASSGNRNPVLNYIWPYWGTDLDGDVIMGSGVDGSHQLTLDTRSVRDNVVGTTYKTDTDELRAALVDQTAWQNFLLCYNSLSGSIHYGKATTLGLASSAGDWRSVVEGKTKAEINKIKWAEFLGAVDTEIALSKPGGGVRFQRINSFYDWLSQYAGEYYGKQFMVKAPFISAGYESDTNRILLSHEPIDSAYVTESDYAIGVANGYMPSGAFRFMDSQNKLSCYIRLNDAATTALSGFYDLSELSEADYESANGYLFVKGEVDPNLVYVDRSALSDPRIVVRTSGRIKPKKGDKAKRPLGALEDIINENLEGAKFDVDEFDKLWSKVGGDLMNIPREGLSYIPNFVATPVRSNVAVYGPWYATGEDGKVEYEVDDSLVPWNYGGYTQMNLAANAKVTTNISYEMYNDGGSIVVPGEPSRNAGDQLIVQSGYPYITDVNVTVGEGGVSTTYILQQWTPRFGTENKQYIERMKKQTLALRRERKRTRQLILDKSRWKTASYGLRGKNFKSTKGIPERERGSSTSFIMGEAVPVLGLSGYLDPNGNPYTRTSFSEVAMVPFTKLLPVLSSNYTRKGGASLDSLFRAFDLSTSGYIDTTTSGVLLPCSENPVDGALEPSVTHLNPYTEPHDMSMFVAGGSVPAGGLAIDASGVSNDSQYRPVGFKMPTMLVGWGYDILGDPVPNSGDGSFIPNHRRRQDQWKAGPLDARWDNERKVWDAGSAIRVVKLLDTLIPGGSTSGVLVNDSTYSTTSTEVTIADPLYTSFGMVDETIVCFGTNGRYEPIGDNGTFRRVTLGEELLPKLSASGLIDGEVLTEIHDSILTTGQSVQGGLQGYTEYHRGDRKWYLTQVACSGD